MKENAGFFFTSWVKQIFLIHAHILPANQNVRLTIHNQSTFVWCQPCFSHLNTAIYWWECVYNNRSGINKLLWSVILHHWRQLQLVIRIEFNPRVTTGVIYHRVSVCKYRVQITGQAASTALLQSYTCNVEFFHEQGIPYLTSKIFWR